MHKKEGVVNPDVWLGGFRCARAALRLRCTRLAGRPLEPAQRARDQSRNQLALGWARWRARHHDKRLCRLSELMGAASKRRLGQLPYDLTPGARKRFTDGRAAR